VFICPTRFSNYVSNVLKLLGHDSKSLALNKKAQKKVATFRLGYHWEIESYWSTNQVSKYKKLIEKSFTEEGIKKGMLQELRGWAEWNLNHTQYAELLTNVKSALELRDQSIPKSNHRYLPEFCTNMGHLGLLSTYLNFYEINDPNRIIHIWPDIAPNKFFLKKITENRNIEIVHEKGVPQRYIENLNNVDNFVLSRISPGNWRFECMAVTSTGQSIVDFSDPYFIENKLSIEEVHNGLQVAKELGIDKREWFVILHIRDSKEKHSSQVQNRDADILDFRSMCEEINELGGSVVRMGSKNFPKLPEDFPAIDYAHSEVRSDFMDVWLWSQCKFWIGNSNGAATPPLHFKKPRIITNLWPWMVQGPMNDIFIPKKMQTLSGRTLSIDEVISNNFGRVMQVNVLNNHGFRLVDNSALDYLCSVNQMLTNIDKGINENLTNELMAAFKTNLNVPREEITMQLPLSFKIN
jgi:putative glycosyltransferase (TIGR04372 family)